MLAWCLQNGLLCLFISPWRAGLAASSCADGCAKNVAVAAVLEPFVAEISAVSPSQVVVSKDRVRASLLRISRFRYESLESVPEEIGWGLESCVWVPVEDAKEKRWSSFRGS